MPTSAPPSKARFPKPEVDETDWVRVGKLSFSPREKSTRAKLTPREQVISQEEGSRLTEEEVAFLI